MSEPKTVLITGATSGIGLETARFLNEAGYQLVLIGRDENKLKAVSAEIENAAYYVINLEDIGSIHGIFDFCMDKQIRLDGMVHAAGYAINMPIRSIRIEHAERQMKVHYYAFLELCKHFYSKRVSNEGGSIVALSSISSSTKLKGSTVYAASKSALNTAVSVISKEFIKRFIRVNALMPAYVDTRMNDGLETLINIQEKQPMGLIPPQNVALLIEFLLSDKSKFITGALIPVSGGMEF